VPYPGQSWAEQGRPKCQPHEYVRNGTAKLLTLFHPCDGTVRVKGVTRCPNTVLHEWLKTELSAILDTLPTPLVNVPQDAIRATWETWFAGLTVRATLPDDLPPVRMLLILDNLKGHHTPDFVLWLFRHGVVPLYTPLGGSWLNMAESVQRIIKRRALENQEPETPDQIMAWLEASAKGWNAHPTAFVWGGKRAARRQRSRQRRHALGGSGACTHRPVRRRWTVLEQWQRSCQMTH
jgi:DDE superfamily endonuclease